MPAKKKATAKKTAKKTTSKKTTAKKTVAKKTAAKKTAAKKKTTAKKTVAKKTTAKKAAVKKTASKKAAAKKTTTKKATAPKVVQKTSPAETKPAPKKPKLTPVELPPGSSFMGIPPYTVSGNEEYMNDHQKDHFRLILETWKRSLMEEVDRTLSHLQDEAANFPDPADRATQEEEFSLELRTRDRERKLIKKIEEALASIDDDDYGYCEACGVEIGIRRLEARPTATLCIDCKTLAEIKEKQLMV